MFESQEIISKAEYCLNCPTKPCQNGCPLSNDTAGFIKLAKENKFEQAYRLLSKTTLFPAICGKICPHSKQCQGNCVRRFKSNPVEIGEIEAYIGKLSLENDWQLCENPKPKTSKKVAIVGGGPAGLTCAGFLAMSGINVTIYEKHNYLGGLFVHGIPNFRLDKNLLNKTIEKIINLGIEVKLNSELGKNLSLENLKNEYDAVLLSFGANLSSKMNIEGENLNGVFGGNEYLENKIQLNLDGKTAIVCGGGNVAMDVSRTLKRQGAKKVIVVYRRSEAEMPAERKEISDAKQEGIEFLFQNNIVKILGQDSVKGVELIKTKLVNKEGETRLSPVNIDGSNYNLDADYIFMAVGSSADKNLTNKLGLETNKYGAIIIDENLKTSNPKVFACGEISTYKKTGSVAWASRSGRDASNAILNFLNDKI